MVELSLGVLVAAAAVDSINPCVFGVLIFLVTYMTKVFKNKHKMLIGSAVYILSVYVSYLLLGLGILKFVQSVDLAIGFYWFAAIVAIAAGLLELKDFFSYGRGFSLQILPGGSKRIEMYTRQVALVENRHPFLSIFLAILLGFFVVLVELPCTGAPYFAILGLLSQGAFLAAIPLLLLYNFIFILPLIIIVGIVYAGTTTKKLKNWKTKHRAVMRLGIGGFLLILGLYMLYTVSSVFQGFVNWLLVLI